jgi:hypothetical protein
VVVNQPLLASEGRSGYSMAEFAHKLDPRSGELSTPERPVSQYLVQRSFEDVPDPSLRRFLNEIPTRFALEADQVDRLLASLRDAAAPAPPKSAAP